MAETGTQAQTHPSAPPPYEAAKAPPPLTGYTSVGVVPPLQAPPVTPTQVVSIEVLESEGDPVGGMDSGNSFSQKSIRHAFIKKVYFILTVQLLVTVGIICLCLFCEPVQAWVQSTPWFYYVSYVIFILTYIVLLGMAKVRRTYPINFICLAIFTLSLSYMAGTITSFYNTTIVLYTMAITAAVCVAISLFAIQTRFDFTGSICMCLLLVLGLVVTMLGFSVLITWLITGPTFAANVLYCVYGGVAALFISLILVVDTQRIVGGKNRKHTLSPEEYITGALELYLDIVYLFLILLSLGGIIK